MNLPVLWLKVRRRLLPWCMKRRCWERSYVLTPKNRPPHRGNLCAVHFSEHLTRFLMEDDHG